MSIALNGGSSAVAILKAPRNVSVQDNQGYSTLGNRNLVSCNSPIIFQIAWGRSISRITNLMTEDEYIQGDLVNVLFEIYMGLEESVSSSAVGNMNKIATLRVSRDIPVIGAEGIGPMYGNFNDNHAYHTFTTDIAPVVRDYLSYTLVPILKGAPSSIYGMSSNYNTNLDWSYASLQGSTRRIDVRIRYEVRANNDDRTLVQSTTNGPSINNFNIINSVEQYDERTDDLLDKYYKWDANESTVYRYLSNCPNGNTGHTAIYGSDDIYRKPIRLEDEAEWLSWFQDEFTIDGSNNYDMTDFYIRITTTESDGSSNTVNLRNIQETLGNSGGSYTSGSFFSSNSGNDKWKTLNTTNQERRFPRAYLTQNVSPAFINTVTAGTITTDTIEYTAQLVVVGGHIGTHFRGEKRTYVLDHEEVRGGGVYPFVRFHWLNRKGGIDSFTFKRNVTESISVNKTFFERAGANQQYRQEYDVNGDYGYAAGTGVHNQAGARMHQDTLGGDNYKPSVSTFKIDALRTNTVFSEPMNDIEARWIEELFTSPNVWIELKNDNSIRAKAINPTSHPSEKDYFPVTINNTNFDIVNEDEGLVRVNIEYTHSNKINTQRG